MKKGITRSIATALALAFAVALGGCAGDELQGKTLYSVSAWNGNITDSGDVTTIAFDEGDGYRYTPGDARYAETGTWVNEGSNIVLTSSLGRVTVLEPTSNGSYQVSEDSFGTRYFLSEQDAKKYCDEQTEEAAGDVLSILEATTFKDSYGSGTVGNDAASRTVPESIHFEDGEATFTKGEYSQEGFIFRQGPSEVEWIASDHSGAVEVTVDEMIRNGSGGDSDWPSYTGLLTIDGDSVEYELELKPNGDVELSIEELTFTTAK